MKKSLISIIAVVIAAAVLFCGCGGVKFVFSSKGDSHKIEVKDAEDGAYAESSAISVGKNRVLKIESSLDKGQISISFVEAINLSTDVDEHDDYISGDTVATIDISPEQSTELTLDAGEYIMQVTAVGDTSGSVQINIEKQ